MNDAHEGDTITLCGGTWDSVEIGTTGVNLVGLDGADVTIIKGSSEPAVTIDGETVTLSSLTLTGGSASPITSALSATDGDIALQDVNITNTTGATLVRVKGSIFEWDGGVIENNDIPNGFAFSADSAEAVTLRHLVFRENNAPGYELLAFYYSSTVMENTIVYDNVANNLLLYGSTGGRDLRISNNVFYKNTVVAGSSGYLIDGDGEAAACDARVRPARGGGRLPRQERGTDRMSR